MATVFERMRAIGTAAISAAGLQRAMGAFGLESDATLGPAAEQRRAMVFVRGVDEGVIRRLEIRHGLPFSWRPNTASGKGKNLLDIHSGRGPATGGSGRMDYTATMTVKTASLLALIGTLLVTILVAVNFFNTIVGVARGIVPSMAILPCVVYLFAAIAVTAFFWVFSRSQA